MSYEYFQHQVYFLKFLNSKTVTVAPFFWNAKARRFEKLKDVRKWVYLISLYLVAILYVCNLIIQTWLNITIRKVSFYERFFDVFQTLVGIGTILLIIFGALKFQD